MAALNVVFLEPSFPDNQKQFVRGLHEVGATVIGIGERPKDWLDGDVAGWLAHYEQVGSVVDEGRLHDVIRGLQQHLEIHRLEAVVEAHVMAAAHVREACGIPGISTRTAFLCRDKPAMKEVLRAAGIRCAASTAARSGHDVREFADEVGYPLVLKPAAGAGASGAERVNAPDELEAAIARSGVDHGVEIAVEEFVEGHEGFYDTITVDGEVAMDFATHYYPNVLEAMRTRWISPQFIATNRRRRRTWLRRSQGDGPGGHRRPRHRDVGDAHGVVRRAEGSVLLGDRLPPARGALLGPLRGGQRHRHLPRVGDGDRARARRQSAVAPVRRGDRRPASRPGRHDQRLRGARRDPAAGTANGSSMPTSRRPAHRPSRSRPGTWRTPGCACATRTTTRCGGCSTTSAVR